MIDYVISSIKKAIEPALPQVMFFNDSTLNVSEIINCTITQITNGTDLVNGDWAIYRIEDGTGIKFKDKGFDLTKRIGIVNGYNEVQIIEHTEDLLEGDLIKCVGIMDIIYTGVDPALSIDIQYKDVIFMRYDMYGEPYGRFQFTKEYLKLDLIVKTKNDADKVKIDSYIETLIQELYKTKLIIPIYDISNKYKGDFQIQNRPTISKVADESNNIQSKIITLIGCYYVNYKFN